MAPLFLNLDDSEWSASCPGCFIPQERAPQPTEYENKQVPELVCALWEKKKTNCPCLESNHDSLVILPSHYSD